MSSVTYVIKLEDLVSSGLIHVADHAQRAEDQVDDAADSVKRMNKQMGSTPGYVKAIGGAIAGYLSFQGITQLVSGVFSVGTEFERLEAVLTNMMGPEAAKAAFADIKAFAETTPFDVQGLTDSFVRLANQGFVPTMDEMRKLGDLASAVGKPFDQLSEAVLDAMTGENERLKEFGIKAQKSGNQTAFTFKGVTTTVNNTSSAIQGYLLSLGDLQGVQGAMDAIMATSGGLWSNFQDTLSNTANELFIYLKPAIDTVVSGLITLVGWISEGVEWISKNDKFIRVFADSIYSYLKPAIDVITEGVIVLVGAITEGIQWLNENERVVKILAGALAGAAIGYGIFTVATAVATGGLTALTASIWASTVAFLASPVGWVVAGFAAIGGGVMYLWETFEGFRGFLYGLWESIGVIFDGIKSIFLDFFGGAYDLIKGVVTFDADLVGQGIEKIGGALVKANPIAFVYTYGEDIAQGFETGYSKGVDAFRADQVDNVVTPNAINPDGTTTGLSPKGGAPGAPGKTNLKAGIAGVEGDAKQVRNLTINIDSLISGGVNINTTKLEQGMGKVRDEVVKTLLGAVNDVNYAGG